MSFYIENKTDKAILENLQKSYSYSLPESILFIGGKKVGVAVITLLSLTIVGGLALLVNHIWHTRAPISDRSLQHLIDHYVYECKTINQLREDEESSQQIEEGQNRCTNACLQIVERVAHHVNHTQANEETEKKMIAAIKYLIDKKSEEEDVTLHWRGIPCLDIPYSPSYPIDHYFDVYADLYKQYLGWITADLKLHTSIKLDLNNKVDNFSFSKVKTFAYPFMSKQCFDLKNLF